jgi:hypothetical protein
MAGDSKRRFCEHCQLHVHNLSEMTASERRRFLATDTPLCVIYSVDKKGSLVTRTDTGWFLTLFQRMRVAFVALAATVLPIGLSSCASRQTMGAPVPPDKNVTPADHSAQQYPVAPGRIGVPPDRQ